MGAVQRLATVVIVGLVALSTILVIYLADESNRIDAEEVEQQHASIERATENYLSLCMSCHGPAGEGYAAGDGRIGMPLGGPNTSLNQQGINAQGTPYPGGFDARTTVIRNTIHDGRGLMPAWGEENGGALNNEQIEELVYFIQHVDWNEVYNEAVVASGGYPTAPAVATAPPEEPSAPTEPNTYNITMGDNFFSPSELILPANAEVTFNFVNEGTTTHNFNIDELDIHSGDLASGEAKSITVTTGDPGEWEYYCAIPGHREAGMVGRLVVTDDPSQLPQPSGAATPEGGEGGEPPAEPPPAADIHVDMVDIAFDPKTITLPANSEVTITLTNTGVSTHNFTAEALGVSSGDLQSGQEGSVTITTGDPGEFTYVCTIPGHEQSGMVGTIVVQ